MMIPEWQIRLARWVNLAVPGTGLLLLGRWPAGLVTLVAFTTAANGVIWSTLIAPEDWSGWIPGAAGGLAAAAYVAAQLVLSQEIGAARRRICALRRREILAASERLIEAGDLGAGLAELERLDPADTRDLPVAVRHAQLLQGLGDWAGARRAWEHVRRIDRHQVYRVVSDEALRALPGRTDDAA